MDIESLKGKQIDEETFGKLKSHIEDLAGQRDAARAESISGRKAMKAENAQLKEREARYLDKLGIDSFDDLEALPAPTGQAEALKQYETKLKRVERDLAEAIKRAESATAERDADRRQAAIARAVAKHGFIDAEDAATLIGARLQTDGDEIFFKADGGKLVPLDDGAAWLAKTKPHLVKAAQAAGSGHRDGGGGSNASTMTRAQFDALPPARKVELAKAGVSLT